MCDLDYVENINHFLPFPLNKWQRFMAFCRSLETGQRLFFSLFREYISTWALFFFINSAIMRMDCVENAVTSLELFEARTFSQQPLGKCEMKSCTCVFNAVVASNQSKSPLTALIATLTLRSCRNRPLGELTGSGNISRWWTQCCLKPKPFGFR